MRVLLAGQRERVRCHLAEDQTLSRLSRSPPAPTRLHRCSHRETMPSSAAAARESRPAARTSGAATRADLVLPSAPPTPPKTRLAITIRRSRATSSHLPHALPRLHAVTDKHH